MKLFLLPLLAILSLPLFVFAQDKVYSPLVDLSNAGQGNDVQTFEKYISFLYGMSIAVAALLAVIKIIIAGTKYMLDDVISGKEDAKKDIQGAVLGLLLILSAVIILELINPDLIKKEIKFDELSKRPKIEAPALTAASTPEADRASAEAAAAAARARLNKDDCDVRTQSNEGDYIVQTLNLTACVKDVSKTRAIENFKLECQNHGGKFEPNSESPTCSWPKEGITKSIYGSLTKQRSKWSLPVQVSTTNSKVEVTNRNSLIDECTSWYGKPTILNAGTVNEVVECDQPAVITYSGNESQFAKGDCSDRIPKGELYNSHFLKAGFGIDYYCVIW